MEGLLRNIVQPEKRPNECDNLVKSIKLCMQRLQIKTKYPIPRVVCVHP